MRLRLLLPLLALGLVGCEPIGDHVQVPGAHGHPVVPYLAMDGAFEMDPVLAATRDDPRNPSRLELTTSDAPGTVTRMTFFAHDDPERLEADCAYQYAGSRPDPHYFPATSKTSIWEVFEQVEAHAGDCARYAVVIARAPHGAPAHMHLRYGTDAETLLAMSLAPVDSAAFEPWWPLYCEAGTTTSCE